MRTCRLGSTSRDRRRRRDPGSPARHSTHRATYPGSIQSSSASHMKNGVGRRVEDSPEVRLGADVSRLPDVSGAAGRSVAAASAHRSGVPSVEALSETTTSSATSSCASADRSARSRADDAVPRRDADRDERRRSLATRALPPTSSTASRSPSLERPARREARRTRAARRRPATTIGSPGAYGSAPSVDEVGRCRSSARSRATISRTVTGRPEAMLTGAVEVARRPTATSARATSSTCRKSRSCSPAVVGAGRPSRSARVTAGNESPRVLVRARTGRRAAPTRAPWPCLADAREPLVTRRPSRAAYGVSGPSGLDSASGASLGAYSKHVPSATSRATPGVDERPAERARRPSTCAVVLGRGQVLARSRDPGAVDAELRRDTSATSSRDAAWYPPGRTTRGACRDPAEPGPRPDRGRPPWTS